MVVLYIHNKCTRATNLSLCLITDMQSVLIDLTQLIVRDKVCNIVDELYYTLQKVCAV